MTDNQQPSLQSNRICRKCGVEKALEDFAPVYSKATRGKNYRQHTCKECHRKSHAAQGRRLRAQNPDPYREACRRSREKHGDAMRKRRREWSYRLRDIVFAHYGGYLCVCCGETEKSMLTLDHINNDGAKHRRSEPAMRWAAHMYAWLIRQKFPPLFQVLCYNCNISKFRNSGTCAHRLKEGSTTIPSGSTAKRPEVHSTQPLQAA